MADWPLESCFHQVVMMQSVAKYDDHLNSDLKITSTHLNLMDKLPLAVLATNQPNFLLSFLLLNYKYQLKNVSSLTEKQRKVLEA